MNSDGGSLAGLAVDFHMAPRLLDEAIDLTKAKTCPVPNVLRCEKRFERAGHRVSAHADAVVGHRQHDVLTLYHFGPSGSVTLVE